MKKMYISILPSISFIALYISFHIIQLLIFLHILGESAVSSVSLEVCPTSHVLCPSGAIYHICLALQTLCTQLTFHTVSVTSPGCRCRLRGPCIQCFP